MRSTHGYDDIINLPRHRSDKRQPMSNHDRAAQFAPFAALTGFGAKIGEAARKTDSRIELSDEAAAVLNERILLLSERISEKPFVELLCFVPDEKKEGGSYSLVSGCVRRIDEVNRALIFSDGRTVAMDNIYRMSGEIFNIVEEDNQYY